MKVGVLGIGAVGGLIAARLARAGHEVSALARGATLEALRRHGLRLDEGGAVSSHALEVSDDPAALGAQDLLVIGLKGPALADVATRATPMIGPETLVLPAMNGVPWWFLRFGPVQRALSSIDPDGRIDAALPLSRVLGCVVHLAASTPEPGLVKANFGKRLIVGEPGGGASARVDAVCRTLADAGFDAEASTDVRREIWFKLWGNMTANPISALTGATLSGLHEDPLVNDFVRAAMGEAAAIGARIGCPIAQSADERIAVARQLGAVKTSMLQDVEAGRPIELDAIVGAVHEIGRRVGVATPFIGALLGLTRLMARQRGLYPPAAPAPT
jgi:2-dehydropantoate 2-reductase